MLLLTIGCVLTVSANTDRSALFDLANTNDDAAQIQLAHSYAHWSSERFNRNKANYWYCRAALNNNQTAIVNIENSLGNDWKNECSLLVKQGNNEQFNIYLVSGTALGAVKLSGKPDVTYTVPSERFWRLTWHQQLCERVCQADLTVKGQIYTDDNKSTAIYGEFDLNAQGESSVIWLFPEATVQINVDLSKVKITEFVQ